MIRQVGPGDLVLMRSFTEIRPGEGGDLTLSYKADKKKHYAFLMLGAIDVEKVEDFSIDDWLIAMGWTPPAKDAE